MLWHCHHQEQAPNHDDDDFDDYCFGDVAHHEMGSEVGHAGCGPLLLLYHGLLHLRELSPGLIFDFGLL